MHVEAFPGSGKACIDLLCLFLPQILSTSWLKKMLTIETQFKGNTSYSLVSFTNYKLFNHYLRLI